MAQHVPPTALTSPLLPGCSAWITVKGKALPVYSSCIDISARQTYGYVAASEGQEFGVCFFNGLEGQPSHDCAVEVLLDGCEVDGLLVCKTSSTFSAPLNSQRRIHKFRSWMVSSNSGRRFFFSKYSPTDDAERVCSDSDPEVLEQFGTIQVRFECIEGVEPFLDVEEEREKFEDINAQDELGPERATAEEELVTGDVTGFVCTYEFRYRTLDFLKAAHLAPLRNPTSKSSTPLLLLPAELPPALQAAASSSHISRDKAPNDQAGNISSLEDDEEQINAAFAETRRRSDRLRNSRSAIGKGGYVLDGGVLV
ncbi:hypothetical protein BCR35DRAFT_335819 [Leucosporidium creatinivorum]|uniref:DUF7918 domain-containing protein n=1 Tax=Leucosporidium creatinivorum TaxID=106004 RepID=A0A1Y2D4X8_9BASI|nr:hypothetical protein BCR35DRAFT_335819 [Leucosporidium creatinivorum]